MARQYSSHLLDIYSVWLEATGTAKGWRQLRKRIPTLEEAPDSLGYTESTLWVPDTTQGRRPATRHISVFIDVEAHAGNDRALVETCAHEAAHVATLLFHELGQNLDDVGHEAHAYLVGWVAQWLWSIVNPAP